MFYQRGKREGKERVIDAGGRTCWKVAHARARANTHSSEGWAVGDMERVKAPSGAESQQKHIGDGEEEVCRCFFNFYFAHFE